MDLPPTPLSMTRGSSDQAFETVSEGGQDDTGVMLSAPPHTGTMQSVQGSNTGVMPSSPSANAVTVGVMSPSTSTFVPMTPKMGGLVRTGSTDYCAWTGGKPLADWSGLDTTAKKEPQDDHQFRPTSPGSAQKSTKYREMGLDSKFGLKSNLTEFKDELMEYFERTGMDTITYLENPMTAGEMLSVVEDYSRFNLASASLAARHRREKSYDRYDKANDDSARRWFLNSLEDELAKKVTERTNRTDGFIAHWLTFIHCFQSSSHAKYDRLKAEIENKRITQYSQQNVSDMATDFIKLATELTDHAMYEHRYTQVMLNRFLEAGGGDGNDIYAMQYRHPLLDLQLRLDKALRHIAYLDKRDGSKYMATNGLTYQDICNRAEDEWKKLVDDGHWAPARTRMDPRRVPAKFHANVAELSNGYGIDAGTLVQALALVQAKHPETAASHSGKGSKTCHNCGQPGHFARECPKKTNPKAANDRIKDEKDFRRRVPDSSWCKKVETKNGEDHWTYKHKGTMYHNCKLCKRWTTTHWTGTHVGKKDKQDKKEGNTSSGGTSSYLAATTGSITLNSLGFFSARMSMHRDSPSWGFEDAFWEVLGAHLPAFFLLLNWIVGSCTIAPMIWLLVGFVLGYGPSRLFPPENWPRYMRRAAFKLFRQRHKQYTKWKKHWKPQASPRTLARRRHCPSAPFQEGEWDKPSSCGRNGRYKAHRTKQPTKPVHGSWSKKPACGNPRKCRNKQPACVNPRKCDYSNFPSHQTQLKPDYPPGNDAWNHKFVDDEIDLMFDDDDTNLNVDAYLGTNMSFAEPMQRNTRMVRESDKMNSSRPWCRQVGHHHRMSSVSSYIHSISELIPNAFKAAMTFPGALYNSIVGKQTTFPLIWDSGASVCLSFDRNDFVGPIRKPPMHRQRTAGVNGDVEIVGEGYVAWAIPDSTGMLRTLKLPAVLAPASNVRLCSTSAVLQVYPNETINLTQETLILSGSNKGPQPTNSIIARINPTNNLPMSIAHSVGTEARVGNELVTLVSEVSAANINLSDAEKEWLKWHQRLGHCGFRIVQFLCRSGALATSMRQRRLHTNIAGLERPPKCAACEYSKAKRQSPNSSSPGQMKHPDDRARSPTKNSRKIHDMPGSLSKGTVHPGQEISADHFVCSTLGRLYKGFGKTSDANMYKGGCIFVDNSSGYVHCEPQTAFSAHETIRAKERFEDVCRDFGVIPQGYLTDNSTVFTSAEFDNHLRQFDQKLRLAGTGAHHQNGIAEKAIQDIQTMARTMLLHAAIHWPDVADPQLWPMAVAHAVHIRNHLPDIRTGLSPADLFTRQRWPHSKFHDLHVFGSPAYKLEKSIADGKQVGKWRSRSTRHVNLGFSPQHASNIPLLLNTETGAIGVNFHVVFDDWFSTVGSSPEQWPDFNSDEWYKMFGDSELQYQPDDLVMPADFDDSFDGEAPMQSSRNTSTLMDAFDTSRSHYRPYDDDTLCHPIVSFEREKCENMDSAKTSDRLARLPTSPRHIVHTQQPVPTTPMSPARPAPSHPLPQLESPAPSHPLPQLQAPPSTPGPALKSEPVPVPSPSSSKVARELRRLAAHNTEGNSEQPVEGKRERKPTTRFVTMSELDVTEFQQSFNFSSSNMPVWNETSEQFDPPETRHCHFSNSTTWTPERHFYHGFKNVQTERGPVGYYKIPASELGYEPGKAPKFLLQQVECPAELLFMSARRAMNDPDTLTWEQAMSESPVNVKKWLDAAAKEIKALEDKHTFDEVAEAEATVKVIPGVWIFKRKRAAGTGEITKWKARWALRGDLQDLDFDTHAPTVGWSTVRLFLSVCLILGWTMKALDFTNAFCQSYLRPDTPVYAYLPRGFRAMTEAAPGQRTILKLRKSQYGLTIAPKLWYEHLRKALTDMGFTPSKIDPCLLYKKDMLLITYVDDCGLGCKDPKMADWFLQELRKRGFELDIEGDFTAFLGVAIEKQEDGTIHMHQRGLIEKILAAADMTTCNPNHTPATPGAALGAHKDAEPWPQTPWRYSSIVGMLVYLAINTRPDIAFAVSQVGRFNAAPKMPHAVAVKMILRYLAGTSDKGIIINPSKRFQLLTYVDADFCGLFGYEDSADKNSARSRGAYIMIFGGVPLIWKTWLITRICLSSCESEYSALSKAMVQVIALTKLIDELMQALCLNSMRATITSRVFEDNNGALTLATQQRLTSRTKYFSSSYHHFWENVSKDSGKDGKPTIEKIGTNMQDADYLTKSLPRFPFSENRKRVQGW